jgi:ABC-type dipeptide/oligopeptide/nickel transport system permease subunit
MLAAAYTNIWQAPFLVYAPGAMITATVLAFSLLGDGLRDAVSADRAARRRAAA